MTKEESTPSKAKRSKKAKLDDTPTGENESKTPSPGNDAPGRPGRRRRREDETEICQICGDWQDAPKMLLCDDVSFFVFPRLFEMRFMN